MLFHEFQEFVTYPFDRDRVRTMTQRLETSQAFRCGLDGNYPADYSPSSERGAIIDLAQIVRGDDVFECMEVDDFGNVCIWTQQKVWFLLRKETANLEKLIFVPRHPPQ